MLCTVMATLCHSWYKVLKKSEKGARENTHFFRQCFEKYYYAVVPSQETGRP